MATATGDEVAKVLNSGYIGQGQKVEEFEAALRERFQTDYVLTTNSATSAEQLVLRLIELQPGDEVLTTPLTCTATNWPILAAGGQIRWIDVDIKTLSIDLDDLARKLTPQTKAIVFVHWGGMVLDLNRLDEILSKYEKLYHRRAPWVIEDCAHAFGTTWNDEPLTARKDNHLRFFSFQAIKHLTCGDGGCLVVPTEYLYRQGKLLRWYGIDRENNTKDFRCEANIPEWGYKFHMNDINATIGLTNLEDVDFTIRQHRENALEYMKHLDDVEGIKIIHPVPECNPSWWLFTLYVDEKSKFIEWMKNKEIMVSRVHERNDKHSCVAAFATQLPNLDLICKHMICIPVGWWLTDWEITHIINSIKEFSNEIIVR